MWVVCSGCDVFDLVEPVQGELPRRTEPSFLCVLVVISLSLIVALSLSISLPLSPSLSLSRGAQVVCLRIFNQSTTKKRHGKGWTQGYDDALDDARQGAQGQSRMHGLQVG